MTNKQFKRFVWGMATAICLLLWAGVVFFIIGAMHKAHADELPKRFIYQYTPDVKITLYPDYCDKQNLPMGWVAEATDVAHKATDVAHKATGCWRHVDDTVLIELEDEQGNWLDFQFFSDKFTPEF